MNFHLLLSKVNMEPTTPTIAFVIIFKTIKAPKEDSIFLLFAKCPKEIAV